MVRKKDMARISNRVDSLIESNADQHIEIRKQIRRLQEVTDLLLKHLNLQLAIKPATPERIVIKEK